MARRYWPASIVSLVHSIRYRALLLRAALGAFMLDFAERFEPTMDNMRVLADEETELLIRRALNVRNRTLAYADLPPDAVRLLHRTPEIVKRTLWEASTYPLGPFPEWHECKRLLDLLDQLCKRVTPNDREYLVQFICDVTALRWVICLTGTSAEIL